VLLSRDCVSVSPVRLGASFLVSLLFGAFDTIAVFVVYLFDQVAVYSMDVGW